ncbi:MAG: hypothetical protein ACKE5Q_00375 [Methylophilaceae bacterium]
MTTSDSNEGQTQGREEKALEIYTKLLTSKGFNQFALAPRISFLKKLMPLLIDKEANGVAYREVLDAHMDLVPESDWPESLVIAREFYPFWVSDLQAVSSISQNLGADTLPIKWKPIETALSELWHSMGEEKFGRTDSWALKAYTKALRAENAGQELIDTRLKLAKILLVRLRDAPHKDNKHYRITVDATLPMFEVKKNRRLFLVVVREFFHFWAGDPKAKEHILINHSTDV